MLHKPVVLKLEEPRVTGQLSQFHMKCHKDDKSLILYTLLKLQLISGKTLMFVKSVEAAYRMKILLERFSINCAVLNADLPHKTRQDIIQAFNQSLVELLVATDSGFADDSDKEDDSEAEDDDDAEEGGESEMDGEDEDEESEEEEEPAPPPKRRRKLGKKAVKEAAKAEAEAKAAAETAAFEAAAEAAVVKAKKGKKGKKGKKAAAEEEEEEPALATVSISVPEAQDKSSKRQQRSSADAQYSLVRGVDLKDVSTVINADMPATVRDYVHRVGRCARGGSSGTALTLCCTDDPLEEARLRRIVRYISSTSAPEHALKELPMQMSDAERFRYRVEDMSRGLTKKVVAQYRARELQMEALNSEKLQSYFEDHPEEKKALQKSQRALKEKKSIRQHLKHIPFYLVPEQFVAATPVQQAVRDEAAKNGGKVPSSVKRKRYLHAQKQDPLQSCEASLKGKRKRNLRFTREAMEAKERRIDPKTANVEDLPPMSGRKLWKLRHGKSVRKKTDQFGERRRMTYGQKRRAGKFAVN